MSLGSNGRDSKYTRSIAFDIFIVKWPSGFKKFTVLPFLVSFGNGGLGCWLALRQNRIWLRTGPNGSIFASPDDLSFTFACFVVDESALALQD